MPWKVSCHMDERMRFVVRLEEGERMTDLCRELGISRKTGYKFWERYRRLGPVGLHDESRRPERVPHKLSEEIAALLVATREAHPTWGPRKLLAWLTVRRPELQLPVASTVGSLLERRGLVAPRRRRRTTPPYEAPLSVATAPNEVWCADFKGQFRLGNGRYCYPLTITDRHSRMLLACEALESTSLEPTRVAFELAFREYGLPLVLRTDNGTPFASRGLASLSRLSVWWLRLGIRHERIEPGHPEQNGQHERMHLDLKRETTRPAAATFLQQQERCDRFRQIYDYERPHEALGMLPPAKVHVVSTRAFPEHLPEPQYPLHDDVRKVSKSGHLGLGSRKNGSVFLSAALAGEWIGLREVGDGLWLVSFMDLCLGQVDYRSRRFVPGTDDRPIDTHNANPDETAHVVPKSRQVSPMLPV